MTGRFLLDEHLPRWWRREVLSHAPDLRLSRIGDANAPALGSSDPVILNWCELHGYILLTSNRSSMPEHLANHLKGGQHCPGIFLVSKAMSIAVLAETLVLISGASLENEFLDVIQFLPAVA